MAWGGEFFSSDIMWWLGDWTRLILHQLPLPRKSLKRGKGGRSQTIRYGIRYRNGHRIGQDHGGLKPYDMESDIETTTALARPMEVSNHIRYGIRYRNDHRK